MSIAKKLGDSYANAKDQIKFRKIVVEIEDVKFDLKVRVPFKREMEDMIQTISSPTDEKVNAIYDRLTKTLKQSIEEGGKDFLEALNSEKEVMRLTENDIILDGTSFRQMAMLTAMWENKVEGYFHLLQSETGEPVNESFDEISEEFPESVIKIIVEKIEQTVKPDYSTAKKN